MNDEIEILEPTPQDALGMTTVLYKTWLSTYPNEALGITIDDIEHSYKDSFTPEKIAQQEINIANTPANIKRIVAKHNGQIVGVSMMVKHENYNQLKTIYVLPEFQGRGIGVLMWNEVKKFYDPKQKTIVQLATYNDQAITFYKKLGFLDTGRRWSDEKWKMKGGAIIPEMEMELEVKND